ncbi:MAG: MotA/TolQ/ExbB proton channel family protein [Oscillospiraceae bacterium]|nr:MotA/TolQ/ExbB proton channel family protein [Oscillospiraceae bacterium]
MSDIKFSDIMLNSISDNWYIIVNVAASFVFLILSAIWAYRAHIKFSANDTCSKFDYYSLDIFYTIFITTISIYPLLGMFGTVQALLSLDMSGDMNGLKENFFHALTSTAWGIIFAVIFKMINAIAKPGIENQIAKAKKSLYNLGDDV